MVGVVPPWPIHAVEVVLVNVGELIVGNVVLVENVCVRAIDDTRPISWSPGPVPWPPLGSAAARTGSIGPVGAIPVARPPLGSAAARSRAIGPVGAIAVARPPLGATTAPTWPIPDPAIPASGAIPDPATWPIPDSATWPIPDPTVTTTRPIRYPPASGAIPDPTTTGPISDSTAATWPIRYSAAARAIPVPAATAR
jgi:hypothetical protein